MDPRLQDTEEMQCASSVVEAEFTAGIALVALDMRYNFIRN